MYLIVGLGNPGLVYTDTRHNAGFLAIDNIAELYKAPSFSLEKKFSAEVSATFYSNDKLLLVKPTTFMNLSGEAVSKIKNFYKIDQVKIIVIHDDVDLPLGKIKVKIGGGSGGHNGLKSLDQCIGNNYLRIRIGVGKPTLQDLSSYVLQKFPPEEKKLLVEVIQNIGNNFELVFSKNLPEFIAKSSLKIT